MTGPFSFDDRTANFSLPLLFAGQAQKEFFVNSAFSIMDAALAKSVIASQSSPPTAPNEGDSYRVTSGVGDWTGQNDFLACYLAGAWHFYLPAQGTMIFDQSTSTFMIFDTNWLVAQTLTEPQGGQVIDTEARLAIGEIIQGLQTLGLASQ